MNTELEREHPLPDKAMFNRTRPSGFAKMGADDVEMIIDCTEFFVEMGDEPFLQKLLWSEYKQRHTLKFLVAISPGGCIVYISEAMPGSITDQNIVRVTKCVDFVRPVAALMADRGFKIWAQCMRRSVRLIMPACSFSAGRGNCTVPMTPREAQNTYEIANLRIHVERAMSEIKKGWRILRSPLVRGRLRLASAIVGVCALQLQAHWPRVASG